MFAGDSFDCPAARRCPFSSDVGLVELVDQKQEALKFGELKFRGEPSQFSCLYFHACLRCIAQPVACIRSLLPCLTLGFVTIPPQSATDRLQEMQLHDLLTKLMQARPDKRLSLAEAKRHPWTSRNGKKHVKQKRYTMTPVCGSQLAKPGSDGSVLAPKKEDSSSGGEGGGALPIPRRSKSEPLPRAESSASPEEISTPPITEQQQVVQAEARVCTAQCALALRTSCRHYYCCW